jgi:uncharacterized protein (TIGR04255 family)
MSDRPAGLPDFARPPVTEVAFSLQFEALPLFLAAHTGMLWQYFREDLPEIEEHAPLPAVIEEFGPPRPPSFDVQFGDIPPLPRVWFLNADKTRLIQVQKNRFIHNWRKLETDKAYPRYEAERAAFEGEMRVLERFLAENNLGELRINQCELTYVNHILPGRIWARHADAAAVFTTTKRLEPSGFLPEVEDYAFRIRYRMEESGGRPFGRLTAAMNPGWRTPDETPVFVLNLTARGRPFEEGLEGALRFFDLGRTWIVKGFAELTTKEMHYEWERTDV